MKTSSIPPAHCCWICEKPIALENCKVDEHGLPVHEECYVTQVASNIKRSLRDDVLHPRGA